MYEERPHPRHRTRGGVDFGWTADGGASTGVFAGASGGGSRVNTTAGSVQVVSLTGTIKLP